MTARAVEAQCFTPQDRHLPEATPPDQPQPDTSAPAPISAGAYKIDRRKAGWNSRCTICKAPDRQRIELALARGASRRSVAVQYDVSDDAIYRHWQAHVPDKTKAILQAEFLKPSATIEALLNEEQPGLLERLERYRLGLVHLFNLGVESGNLSIAPITRELREIETLIASQLGTLRARTNAPIQHLHVSADFVRLRQTILIALRPYPDALAAVSVALRAVDEVPPVMIDARPSK